MAKHIPGTRVRSDNQQLLISSGIPALDELLGGGLPVGTIALIEEDYQGIYSKTVLKYFIAEGIENEHSSFIASLDINPSLDILYDVAEVTVLDENVKDPKKDKMVIAFRYENLSTEYKISSQFGHYYDLSRKMDHEKINKLQNFTWNGTQHMTDFENHDIFTNHSYWDLLRTIISTIVDNKFLLTDNVEKRSILRIVLHSLGSPLWIVNDKSSEEHVRDLRRFFVYLRYIVRKAFAVCVISVPTHFCNEVKLAFDAHLTHNSDIVFQLDAFAGTHSASNPILCDYHGYFRIVKVAAINSFKSNYTGSAEYTFRLKRKKFVIEKLHLPPDIQQKNSDSEFDLTLPSFGCGSSNKHLLEF